MGSKAGEWLVIDFPSGIAELIIWEDARKYGMPCNRWVNVRKPPHSQTTTRTEVHTIIGRRDVVGHFSTRYIRGNPKGLTQEVTRSFAVDSVREKYLTAIYYRRVYVWVKTTLPTMVGNLEVLPPFKSTSSHDNDMLPALLEDTRVSKSSNARLDRPC